MAVTQAGALTGTKVNDFERGAPGRHYFQVPTRAKAASSEATKLLATWMAPFACKLKAAYFAPLAAVSGANTNTTHLNVLYAGITGGTTELSSLELTSGNDLDDAEANVLSEAYTQALSAGDFLSFQGELVGTGLAVPEGTWIIAVEGA